MLSTRAPPPPSLRSAKLPAARAVPLFVLAELLARQRALTLYAGLLLALLVPTLLAAMIDPRTIEGVGVWDKPAKFLFSIAVFALSSAWFFGYVRPERRRSRTLRGVVIVTVAASSFELAYIGWQAAHGLASHFNRSTLFYNVMYGLMGVGAIALVATTLPLAVAIFRWPNQAVPPRHARAAVAGLVLCCVLGGGLGFYMAQQTGHAVGLARGHLPLFGWNRGGGDLRIAHFLGIHAEQAIPLLGWLPRPLFLLGTALYVAVTLAVFVQALHGLPLIPI